MAVKETSAHSVATAAKPHISPGDTDVIQEPVQRYSKCVLDVYASSCSITVNTKRIDSIQLFSVQGTSGSNNIEESTIT